MEIQPSVKRVRAATNSWITRYPDPSRKAIVCLRSRRAATDGKDAFRKTGPARPQNSVALPDLDQAKSAVLNSLSSTDAQRGYRHAIEEFIEWYCSEPRLSFSKSVVLRYRIHLPHDLRSYAAYPTMPNVSRLRARRFEHLAGAVRSMRHSPAQVYRDFRNASRSSSGR